MKKLDLCLSLISTLAFTAVLVLDGCGRMTPATPAHYEFKVLYEPVASEDDKSSQGIQVPEADLNVLGKSGWGLVSSYLEVETVFPNLGDPKYITGIHDNTRPKRAVFVFERPAQ